MEIRKNDDLTLEITDYTSDGSGLGKVDGMAVFVPNGVVGDCCSVHIIKVTKNYCVGKISKILKPSKNRIEPDCPAFERCGGCAFRNIPYEKESEFKQKRVSDCLLRIGGIEMAPEKVVSNGITRHYRNKAQFKIEKTPEGRIIAGFFAPKSHRVIECKNCPLHPKEFALAVEVFCKFLEKNDISVYNEETGKGLVRQLYLRMGENSGQLMVCVVINGNRLFNQHLLVEDLKENLPCLESVVINENRQKTNVVLGEKNTVIYGGEFITDRMCDLNFRLSPHSFYQVNSKMAELLFERAGEFAGLTGNETVLDLYCGAGAIGLSLAKKAKKIIGVEIVPQAVENARFNAQNNGIENCEFICSDASAAASLLAKRKIKPDVVVIDPPRKGCDSRLIDIIAQDFSPQRVVYVSCDPATLSRDLKIFSQKGYSVEKITPFDLFPRTVHVESVVLLTKVHK